MRKQEKAQGMHKVGKKGEVGGGTMRGKDCAF